MKILITGACGFIGHHLIEKLLPYCDLLIANGTNKKKAESFTWFDKVKFVETNIYEIEQNYYELFDQPDILIHLAWRGLDKFKDPSHVTIYSKENYNFIKNLIDNGTKEILVAGTCLEYGLQSGCLHEDLICNPTLPYAIGKYHLYKSLIELQTSKPFSLKWARIFYPYGEGQREGALLPLLDKALAKCEKVFPMSLGQQIRDFLSVEEVADQFVKILLQHEIQGIINCCSGKPITVESFVRNYLRQRNKTIHLKLGHFPYADYEPIEFWGDTKKLSRLS